MKNATPPMIGREVIARLAVTTPAPQPAAEPETTNARWWADHILVGLILALMAAALIFGVFSFQG
jgi:cytochrome b561